MFWPRLSAVLERIEERQQIGVDPPLFICEAGAFPCVLNTDNAGDALVSGGFELDLDFPVRVRKDATRVRGVDSSLITVDSDQLTADDFNPGLTFGDLYTVDSNRLTVDSAAITADNAQKPPVVGSLIQIRARFGGPTKEYRIIRRQEVGSHFNFFLQDPR